MIDANTFSANAGKTLCQRTDISKRPRATHATPTESGVKKNSGDWISSLMRSMLLSNTIRAYRVSVLLKSVRLMKIKSFRTWKLHDYINIFPLVIKCTLNYFRW